MSSKNMYINIKIDDRVIYSNADQVNNNIYTWIITRSNYNNKKINISYTTNKNDYSDNNSDNTDNNDDKEIIDKNEEIENNEEEINEDNNSSSGYTIIFLGMIVLIFIIGIIGYIKYKSVKNS